MSRSYFGKLIPQQEAAEYFGYYNVVSRFAVILGPAVVGVCFLTRRAGLEYAGIPDRHVFYFGIVCCRAVLLLLANKRCTA